MNDLVLVGLNRYEHGQARSWQRVRFLPRPLVGCRFSTLTRAHDRECNCPSIIDRRAHRTPEGVRTFLPLIGTSGLILISIIFALHTTATATRECPPVLDGSRLASPGTSAPFKLAECRLLEQRLFLLAL